MTTKKEHLIAARALLLKHPISEPRQSRALAALHGVESMSEEQAAILYDSIEASSRRPSVERASVESLASVWEAHWRNESQQFLNDVRGVKR